MWTSIMVWYFTFFSTKLSSLMYKKSNSFVYIFVVNYQFSPNNSVRVRPTNLKIDMLYHINYTFRSTVFSISVDVSLSSLPIITPNIFSSQLFGNFNPLNIISPFWLPLHGIILHSKLLYFCESSFQWF